MCGVGSSVRVSDVDDDFVGASDVDRFGNEKAAIGWSNMTPTMYVENNSDCDVMVAVAMTNTKVLVVFLFLDRRLKNIIDMGDGFSIVDEDGVLHSERYVF